MPELALGEYVARIPAGKALLSAQQRIFLAASFFV
jgi:hypothetical protein